VGQRVAWLLNFEADLELARTGAFNPGRDIQRLVAGLRARHGACLMDPGDVEIDEHAPLAGDDRGLRARAWCPTPRALSAIERAGAIPPRAPEIEVLRQVNGRGFNASLGQVLPGAVFVSDIEILRVELAQRHPGDTWLLKRAFSVAGRGQRRVSGGELTGSDVVWARAALRLGGLQLEPLVEIEVEYVLHGHICEDGSFGLGPVCIQECDDNGAWFETRQALGSELAQSDRDAIEDEGQRVAQALAAARYFGPFGIDAFRWRGAGGQCGLQPRSEINARYTLGWRVGFPAGEPV
jgi:hypothetical protein